MTLKKEGYKERLIDKKIEECLKIFGAVSIVGPKYCGKTWAGRYHSNSEILLHETTGEASNNVELAKILNTLDIDAVELNLSCPNVKAGCMAFGTSYEGVKEVTTQVRKELTSLNA